MFIGLAPPPDENPTDPPPLDGLTVVLIHTKFVQSLSTPTGTSIMYGYVCAVRPFGPREGEDVHALSAIGVVHD